MLARARRHPFLLLAVATLVAAGGLVLAAWAAGWSNVADAFSTFRPGWLALVIGGQVLALPAYVAAYRATAAVEDGPELPVGLAARLVAAGFGPFASRGGFTVDQRALSALDDDRHERPATVRVLGLGSVEYALLAPVAWICALVALSQTAKVPLGFSLPWAIAVPIGFGTAVWAAHPKRRRKLEGGRERRWKRWLATALAGVDVLRRLTHGPRECWVAYPAMACYWAADIASFYGGLRAFGATIGFTALLLAYASGYAATRRTLPFAGAGITELLLAYFTSLMHVGFGLAVAGVALYRAANLFIPGLAALESWPRVRPLVDAAERSDRPAAPAAARGSQ